MLDSLLADGLGAGLSEKVASYAIKGLAVAGGFLIGYFLGKVVAWALDRWLLANKSPDQLKKAISLVAGVALAVLVALVVFGEGGSGLFGSGGGTGDGKSNTTSDDKGKTPPAPPDKKDETPPKKDETPKPVDPPKPMPGDMHITILAGADAKQRSDGKTELYVIDGDPTPKTFDELKDAVNIRRKMTTPELKHVYYRFKNETLSTQQPAVQQVYLWLSNLKIGFTPE